MGFGPYIKKPSVRVQNFEGGLNTKADEIFLDPEQSPSAQNVVTDDFGAVGTNPGYTLLNTAAVASAPIDGIVSYNKTDGGTPSMIIACNGDIFSLSGTTFQTIPSAQSVFTGGQDMEFHQFQNLLFMGNGTNRNYKWNGTEFTRMGVSAPVQTLSAATNGAGTLTGSYSYVFTAVNSYSVESDYGGLDEFTAVSEAALVSNIPTAPASHGVNQWFVYRNTAAASGVYYRVTAVTNGVTSFVDNNSDSTLVTEAPTDNAPPPNFKYMISFKGILFAAGDPNNPSYLWHSEINTPELYPTTNFIRVGLGDGLKISGLAIQGDTVVISKSDDNGSTASYSLYVADAVGFTSTANWYLQKSDSAEGSESHRAMVNFSNVVSLFNRDGCFAFAGNNLVTTPAETNLGTQRVDSLSFNVEPDFQAFKKSLLPKAAGILYNNKVYFSVASSDASSENDKLYVFDFVRAKTSNRVSGSWIPFTDHNISDFAIHQDNLYGGSSLEDGFVYQLDNGTNYNSGAIDSFFVTAPTSGVKGDEEKHKVFRYVYLLVECKSWNAFFTPILDFDTGSGTQRQISLECPGSNWGTMVWGTDSWGLTTGRKRIRIQLPNTPARYFQFKISTNTADQSWKLYSYEVYYNTRGLRANG